MRSLVLVAFILLTGCTFLTPGAGDVRVRLLNASQIDADSVRVHFASGPALFGE